MLSAFSGPKEKMDSPITSSLATYGVLPNVYFITTYTIGATIWNFVSRGDEDPIIYAPK
jgi:hypothetical protein